MKSFKNIFYFGVLSVLIVTVSCHDDEFLEENPSTFYTIDNIFTTSAQIDQVLTGIYSKVRYMWTNVPVNHDYFNFKGKGTDLLDITYSKRGQGFSDYSIINPDHSTFQVLYADFYTIISRANLAIYASELPQIAWGSIEDKAYTVAQARFFRAFAYRNLAELWGGVPIVEELVSAPRFDFVRAGRLETYQFAIDEMEAILNDLPETTPHGGRIVRGAAQHNLCELYLAKGIQQETEGDANAAQASYAKAISYADQVIDGGVYSLMTDRFGARKNEQTVSIDIHPSGNISLPVADTICMATNHYWDLFQEGNVNYQDGNRECIWAAQIDYEAYRAKDGSSKLPYSQAYSPVLRDGTNGHIVGMLEDIGGRPNSHTTQNWYVRDSIWSGKWWDDVRNSEIVFRRRFKGNAPDKEYYLKPVPWQAIYYGADDQTKNTNNQNMSFPLSCKICTDKYVGIADGQVRQNLFRDEYLIRLPETILLRAEAKQRSGNKAGAASDINLLRDRARCVYKVTASDMDDQFNLILDERARELLYEECRWNTLLRMGGTVAVDRILKYSFWPETKATLTFKYNLWPVPQSVIDVNKDVPME
ncbi:MAG: RagB/SusD family nutrient uptake outer membrane protein, partial [Tannerella sp.]|nr:RagB/SusD family nutrient uptake outer membrane protein [Tannerella sp.]